MRSIQVIYQKIFPTILYSKVMASMLRKLEDAHTNLVSTFNVSFYQIDLQGPDNFIFSNYRRALLA